LDELKERTMAVIVITGCSSGIGLAAAQAFADAGDTVVATVRDPNRSVALSELGRRRGAIEIATLDVTKPATFATFLDDLGVRHGRLDVLINNAGVLPVGAFEDFDEQEFRLVMETNFFGPALLAQAALPIMRAQNGGHIIMMSSLSGIAAKAGDSIYAASKFALEGLTEALRQEVARWNIRATLVEPAGFDTNIFQTTAQGSLGACSDTSPYRPLIAAQQAELRANLGKGFDPRDLGKLLVDIARSEGSRFRWPADPVAERVTAALIAGDDASRTAFLDKVSGVGWWVAGLDAPAEANADGR
jgi:NAD(P)-dependent dehydrogenase (short-subunit alcohol dehydrogenase family)